MYPDLKKVSSIFTRHFLDSSREFKPYRTSRKFPPCFEIWDVKKKIIYQTNNLTQFCNEFNINYLQLISTRTRECNSYNGYIGVGVATAQGFHYLGQAVRQ